MRKLAKLVLLAALGWFVTGHPMSGNTQVHPTMRVRISEGVARGLLVKQVDPVYPEEAKRRGIEGLVKLSAVISKEGDVKFISVISGDAALTSAAVTAVKKWRFLSYKLNGESIDAETELTIPFHLNQK
jgi:TonB family protein